jgi:hypothetical protein
MKGLKFKSQLGPEKNKNKASKINILAMLREKKKI